MTATRRLGTRRLGCLAVLLLVVPAVGCSGFKGRVLGMQHGGGLGPVSGAHIIFKSDDGHTMKAVHGDVHGKYTVDLPKGWYSITATAPSCREYTAPAPTAVTGGGTYDHMDIHMEKR